MRTSEYIFDSIESVLDRVSLKKCVDSFIRNNNNDRITILIDDLIDETITNIALSAVIPVLHNVSYIIYYDAVNKHYRRKVL